MNKQALRTLLRARRKAVTDRLQKDERICRQVLGMEEYVWAQCILCYAAIGSEVDLKAVMVAALQEGKRLCLPVCLPNGEMCAVQVQDLDALKPGAFSIPEPQGVPISPDEIDLVLCPGLGFDECGGRLGYGRGYYDRYLLKVHAFLAGICYTDCIVDCVPVGAQDVPMHALVCEKGIKRIGGLT